MLTEAFGGRHGNGIPHGNGKYTDVNGDIMEGDFVDGMLHGYGRHERADGIVHEGDFWKGMAHGKAKVIMPNGAELAGISWMGSFAGRLVGHYDRDTRGARRKIVDEDAWRFKGRN